MDENHEFCDFLRCQGDRNCSRDHISILKCKVSKVHSKTKTISLSKQRIYRKDTILNVNMPGKGPFSVHG